MADEELVHAFGCGKNNWNHFEIVWDGDEILLRDNVGHIRFNERDFDEFYKGMQKIKETLDERRFGFLDEEEDEDGEPDIWDEDDVEEPDEPVEEEPDA